MPYRAWIIAFTLGLMAQSFGLNAQNQSNELEQAPRNQHETADQSDQAEPFSIPIRVIKNDEITDARERREAIGQELQERDLEAQEGMNHATQSIEQATWLMFWVGVANVIFVAVGTALLVWTLHLTRQANSSAKETIIVARETGLQQLRPWLIPVGPEITEASNVTFHDHTAKRTVAITAIWANQGQSPATNAICGIDIRTVGNADTCYPIEWKIEKGTSIVGQGQRVLSGMLSLSEEDYQRFSSGEAHILVASKAIYNHSLDPNTESSAEIEFRVYVNGVETDRNTGQSHPRYQIDVVRSEIS